MGHVESFNYIPLKTLGYRSRRQPNQHHGSMCCSIYTRINIILLHSSTFNHHNQQTNKKTNMSMSMETVSDPKIDTRTDEQKAIDEWLPVTSSRNAKWWYSAFHNVTAMVGAGVLSLPYALSELGWYISFTLIPVCFCYILVVLIHVCLQYNNFIQNKQTYPVKSNPWDNNYIAYPIV